MPAIITKVPACVVDASVLAKLFLPEQDAEIAAALMPTDDGRRLRAAPDLAYLECANILWKWVRRGRLSAAEAAQGVRDLHALPLQTWRAKDLLDAALSLAVRFDVSVYDAAYLALADLLALPLVTADEALVRKAGGPSDRLIVLASLAAPGGAGA